MTKKGFLTGFLFLFPKLLNSRPFSVYINVFHCITIPF